MRVTNIIVRMVNNVKFIGFQGFDLQLHFSSAFHTIQQTMNLISSGEVDRINRQTKLVVTV
ncbi:hypothetical protein D3C80_984880 [compost metagenome]